MEQVVTANHCNICELPFSGGEKGCVGHLQIISSMWNANAEYQQYQNFLTNKHRQQIGLPAIEFNHSKKNQFTDNS